MKTVTLCVLVTLFLSLISLRAGEVITLVAGDPLGYSSFVDGENWSDESPPSEDKDYSTRGYLIRSQSGATGCEFPGHSLTLANGGHLALTNTGTVLVNNLIMAGGDVRNFLTRSPVSIAGTIYVPSHTSGLFRPYVNRVIYVDSVISGEGFLIADEGTVFITNENNSWTGGLIVGAGSFTTINVTADGALGAGDIHVSEMGEIKLGGGRDHDYIGDGAILFIDNNARKGSIKLDYRGVDVIAGLKFGSSMELKPGTYNSKQINIILRDEGQATVDIFEGRGSLRIRP